MQIQTLRESLKTITKANQTVKAVTDRVIEELNWAAEDGVDTVTAHIPKDVAYEVLANLTNPLCKLTCECIDDENSLFEISWD